jgi:hypothetical protein
VNRSLPVAFALTIPDARKDGVFGNKDAAHKLPANLRNRNVVM